ncbi:proline transporter 1 [Quercus suber]|uniref:Proline transporter 1 n=1 Tax=Quercus suber TaxID=58331 RepID=A0AAW0K6A8_QUESU
MHVPKTLVFPSMIYIKVKGKSARLEKKLWHWFNIVLFFFPCCGTISAVRLIIDNVQTYSFFADA